MSSIISLPGIQLLATVKRNGINVTVEDLDAVVRADKLLDRALYFPYLKITEVRKLNRESREIREWSRRCDPASFGLNERGTFLVVVRHCFDGS